MFGCQLAKRGQCVLSGERLVGGKHTGRLLAREVEWVFTHNVTNAQTGDNVWARYELRHLSGIFVKLRLTGHQVCGLVGSGANQPPTTTVQGRICQAVTSPFWT